MEGNTEIFPVISGMEISTINDADLEAAFRAVVIEHKDAVESIHQSMVEATAAYEKYLVEGYVPFEDIAKKDRATLNNAEKNIAAKYAALKAAYEKPLENIEVNIRSIRHAIKKASGVVDTAVKVYVEKEQKEKRKLIQTYWDSKKFDLLPLENIFDPKWLNKGTKIKDIRERIDEIIAGVYRDIEVLEKIETYRQTAKAFYLQNLDLGAALRQVDILKENAEKLAWEQVNREDRKIQEQVDRNASSEQKEKWEREKDEKVHSMVDQALDLPQGTTAAEEREAVIEYTMTFKGTKDQLLKLREFMMAQGILYHKGLLFNSEADATQVMKNKNLNGKIFSFIYTQAA